MSMELSALISQQIERDRRRGFTIDFENDATREEQLMRDLVGLFGEIGEFSNLLKKVMLARTTAGYAGPTLSDAAPALREAAPSRRLTRRRRWQSDTGFAISSAMRHMVIF